MVFHKNFTMGDCETKIYHCFVFIEYLWTAELRPLVKKLLSAVIFSNHRNIPCAQTCITLSCTGPLFGILLFLTIIYSFYLPVLWCLNHFLKHESLNLFLLIPGNNSFVNHIYPHYAQVITMLCTAMQQLGNLSEHAPDKPA